VAQVVYENEQTILCFEYRDVLDNLTSRIKENDVEEDTLLRWWLEMQSDHGEKSITINAYGNYKEARYLNRIVHVMGDLLTDGKGRVYRKAIGNGSASGA